MRDWGWNRFLFFFWFLVGLGVFSIMYIVVVVLGN